MYTKGPWKQSHIQSWGIETPDKDIIRCYGDNSRGNVDRIVLCVNSHDELLAALETISNTVGGVYALEDVRNIARAAIAKARGE